MPLTIRLSDPPASVTYAVQVGKTGLAPPTRTLSDALEFDIEVTLADRDGDAPPRFGGPLAQGPAGARFVYVNVGTYAGQTGSPWGRRVKVHLAGIDWPLIEAVLSRPGARLQAAFAGKDRKDEPACATVPLLDGGWRLAAQAPS